MSQLLGLAPALAPSLPPAERAARAWAALGRATPHRVTALRPRGGASGVLRLVGIPGTGDVIAKCAGRAEVEREALVLGVVLRATGVRGLTLLGTAEDDHGRAWLFVQAAPGTSLRGQSQARAALARAAAALHSQTEHLNAELAAALPTPPNAVMKAEHLSAAAEAATGEHPVAEQTLSCLVDDLVRAGAALADVDALLEGLAPRVTHGDLVAKNAHLADDGSVWLYDWETACWGPPAQDLEQIDLDVYAGAVPPHGRWWGADLPAVARAGAALRLLDGIQWAIDALTPHWPDRPLRDLEHYRTELQQLRSVRR